MFFKRLHSLLKRTARLNKIGESSENSKFAVEYQKLLRQALYRREHIKKTKIGLALFSYREI
jgi:hypothetical protein